MISIMDPVTVMGKMLLSHLSVGDWVKVGWSVGLSPDMLVTQTFDDPPGAPISELEKKRTQTKRQNLKWFSSCESSFSALKQKAGAGQGEIFALVVGSGLDWLS